MSAAGLASTATHAPRSVPSTSTTRRADQLVHPQRVGVVERLGVERLVGERSAAVRSGISSNLTTRRPFEATRADLDRQGQVPRATPRCPGASARRIVGQQLDEDVATQAVGAADVTDLEAAVGTRQAWRQLDSSER